jgi:hypothetical protein
MKVFWEDFGIHVQAEDDGENEALSLIWNRIKSIRVEATGFERKESNSGRRLASSVGEPLSEIVIAD